MPGRGRDVRTHVELTEPWYLEVIDANLIGKQSHKESSRFESFKDPADQFFIGTLRENKKYRSRIITPMKYQVSFRAKTWYLHMWKYYLCYGYIINRAFHTKTI